MLYIKILGSKPKTTSVAWLNARVGLCSCACCKGLLQLAHEVQGTVQTPIGVRVIMGCQFPRAPSVLC